ncbi:MAG TPA: glycine betaine ABC transporter substrate-binding protein [Virgibacillus sp.]|nr:glycine betaine ABC transporter substrate-binding protein [Virgibacillus sp.]
MLKRYFKLLGVISILTFAVILTGCSADALSQDKNIELGEKEIEIPYSDAGSTVRSFILSEVLEDVGYDVTLTQVQSDGSMYASIAEDKDAFHTSGWLPSTHKDYFDKYGDDIEAYKGSDIIEETSLSLAVPEYMDDIDSMEDLKDNEELGESVNWTITGIDPRNGIMRQTDKAIEDNDYGLGDWELHEGSELSMISELMEKYEKQEPIIITGWAPHWIFNEMDLKMLDDPNKVYAGTDDHINLVFNKNFADRHPAAYKIATRMAKDWDKDDENKLMKDIFVKEKNKEKIAEDFVDDHSNKVDKWKEGIDEK